VLSALDTEHLHIGLATESLLQALLDAGDPLPEHTQLQLSDVDRSLLAQIVMREDEPLTPELVQGAVDALRHRSQLAQREREIIVGIVDAERRQDMAALVRLKQEKLELDRKLAGKQS